MARRQLACKLFRVVNQLFNGALCSACSYFNVAHFRKIPHIMTWVGAALAFTGLVLLTGNGFKQISLSFGQLLTVLGAFAIALEIIFISYFAGKVNLRRVTIIQLSVASLLSFAIMPIVGEHTIPAFSWPLVLIAVALGLASALIQFVMNWAQRVVDPSRAAIIYAGEPVWAGIIGRIAGERLPVIALLGCFSGVRCFSQ